MSAALERLPHAILDQDSRLLKAAKIADVMSALMPLEGASLLDVGTGSGHVAAALARRAGLAGAVWSVDVLDQRRTTAGYDFALVEDVALPFPDGSFDAAVSNHVIEHVGGEVEQLRHLKELRRVLHKEGIGYLAVPSRWVLVEPHFRLPLLSWLPRALRTPYVRVSRRGVAYDCKLLTRRRLRLLASAAGLELEDATMVALATLVRIEGGSRLRRLAARAPRTIGRFLSRFSPTIVVLLRPGR